LQEHLFIVSELLKDNLYEFGKYIRDHEQEAYFTLERLQRIMKQCLEALAFIHSLNLIHCDIKPENIVIKSYSRCEVKIIDFGSSCFTSDHLTSYIQSRSYRAPEVILGVPYGQKIDLWSLGCVLAELYSGTCAADFRCVCGIATLRLMTWACAWAGYVLFQNDSIQSMLARMIGILGPIPEDLLVFGRDVLKYFTCK
jgi:serine/threonine protein kinase